MSQQKKAGGPPAGEMSGGSPTPEDIQAQQEATEFLSNIMMEVREHDMKQAEAMQEYMQKLKFWQRWSIFGGKNLPVAAPQVSPAEAAAATNKADILTSKQTLKDGSVVERSRATTQSGIEGPAGTLTGAAAAAAKAAAAAERAQYSPYLFRKVNPHYVPILQRWWIPYVSVLGIFVVWSPDAWKLRTLYYLDWRYDQVKGGVHKLYWKATMPADEYETLCKELEANDGDIAKSNAALSTLAANFRAFCITPAALNANTSASVTTTSPKLLAWPYDNIDKQADYRFRRDILDRYNSDEAITEAEAREEKSPYSFATNDYLAATYTNSGSNSENTARAKYKLAKRKRGMQAIGKFLSYTANSLDITTCANDVIVIRHADGTLHSSPFFVRFGRGHVLRPSDKIVQIEINGEMTEAVMKMGDDGTAFWLEPTVVSNVADIGQLESPVGSPNRSPTSGESPKLKEFALPGSNVESSPAKKGDGSSPRSPNSQKAGTASATGALSSQPPSEQTNTSATTSPSAGLGNSISPHTAAGSPSSTLTAVNTSTNKKVQLSNGPLSNTSAPQKAGSSPGQHLPEPLEQTLADSPLAAAKGMGPSVRSDASFATCIDGTERRDSMTFSPTKDGRLLQRSAAATTTVAEDFHHPTSVDGEVSRHVDVGSYPEGSMPEANLPEGAARLAVAEAKVDGAAAARSDKHNNEIDDDSILSDDVDPADRMAYSELIQSLEASKAVTPLMAANMSAAASFPDLSGSPEPGSATANMRDSSGDDVTSPPSFSKPPLAPSPAHGRQLQSSSTPPMSSLSSMAHHNRVGSVGDLVLSKFASIDNMAEEQPSTSTPPQGHLKGPTNRSRSGSELVGIEKAATVATARPRRASNSPMEQLKEALADGVPPPKQNSVAAAVTDNAAGAMASVAAQVIAAGDPRTPTTPEIEGVTSAVYDSDLDEDSNEDVLEYGSEEEYIDEEKEPLNATLGAAAASAGDGPVVMIPPGALFQRTLTPIAADLKRLNLKEGANLIRYRTTSSLRGSTYIEGRIFLWGPNTKIVVSDVDGTITKSDVLGHILPLVGKDWTHTGICDLYTKCAQNGYQFLYVTARSVSYMAGTRRFLWGIVQDKKRLPLGPIMTAPDRFFAALTTEVSKRSHEFKIACLEGVKKAFPVHAKPFYAGFGNRINDVVAYSATGIPKHKIFIIDHEGVVHVCKVQQSYNNLSHLVHETFPPLRGGSCVRQHPHSFATNNYPGAEASLPAAAIQGVLPGNAPSAKACGGGNASLFGVPGADSTNHDSLGNSIDDPNVDIKLENQTSAASTARPGSPAKEQGHNSGSASPGVTADRPSSAGGNNTNRSTSSQLGSSFNDAVLDSYEDPHQEEQDFNSFNFWRMDPKDYLGPPAPTKKLSGIKDGKEGTGSTAANAKQRPRSPLTHDHILVAPSQAGKEGINASKWASTVGSTKEVPIAKAPVPGESSKGGLRSWIPWPRSHKPVAPPTSAATAADHTAKTSAPPINTSTTPSAVQSGGPSPTSVPTTPSKPKETK